MTVKELMEALSNFNQDMEVYVYDNTDAGGWYEPSPSLEFVNTKFVYPKPLVTKDVQAVVL